MIELLLQGVGVYLAFGLLFALACHIFGLSKIDAGVKGAGPWFRLLVTPGLVALWPWMLILWRRGARGEDEDDRVEHPVPPGRLRGGHRRLVLLVLAVVPLLAVLAVVLRPSETLPTEAERASERRFQDEPRGEILAQLETPFRYQPIRLHLRGEGSRVSQLELVVAEDLDLPAVALYWTAEPPEPVGSTEMPPGAVYLGPVFGPAELRYRPPNGDQGTLWLYTLGHGKTLGLHVLGDVTLASGSVPAESEG
ncbi:MAG: hypothetical protein SX243_19515 [Acidobacteriota bacterium]|nr:hypothetical protein [Acidobacteriota bacterium]